MPVQDSIISRLAELLKHFHRLVYLEELLDSIFYYNKGEKLESDETTRQMAIFFEVVTVCREQLFQTKYAFFQDWSSYDENEQSSLFQIYRLTQLVKFKLAIKKFQKDDKTLQVGHYTKRNTLDKMVRYRKEDVQSGCTDYPDRKVESKSRLYNANYMNDTQEGILLDKALDLPESDKLQPSSWYLMSLTNNHDNLSMWSQYGESGEGVCIVLGNDSFKEVSEVEEMDSFTAKKIVAETSEELNLDNKVEKHEVEKDELYRICYLKDNKVIKSNLFEEEDITKIQNYLDELKDAVEGVSSKKIREAIDTCLEEIRYLFKSADYAYESEVRILKYVSEKDRKDVKYDLDDVERRLYIERKTPMQIEKIIFGPKFANADFATPYIQWVDKNIQFERSRIHYR